MVLLILAYRCAGIPAFDGALLGAVDGVLLGAFDGALVGAFDGVDGALLGAFDGALLGELVIGTAATTDSQHSRMCMAAAGPRREERRGGELQSNQLCPVYVATPFAEH